ncbi:MAG: hypothetical protein LIP77_00485 [Planctomycetes bacterium]|nr:hypothetical protein [Planctomycetota bacterium]
MPDTHYRGDPVDGGRGMAAIYQFYELPYANVAAEEMRRVEDVPPVAAVEATSAVQPVRPVGERVDDGLDTSDGLAISYAARHLVENIRHVTGAGQSAASSRIDSHSLSAESRHSPALQELVAGFAGYNNDAAVRQYNYYLGMFTTYGTDQAVAEDVDALATVRSLENGVYGSMGIALAGEITREMREGIGAAIDRWIREEGVYMPGMLWYASSDGFRFTPLSRSAAATTRSADVMSTYDRIRIAAYLRELAQLTPNDFLFYDPTGLDLASLDDRREFLTRVDRLLAEERIDLLASEIHYGVDGEGSLDLQTLRELDREDQQRLEALRDQLNTYYGMLRNSVAQYQAGIISASLQ